MPCSGAGFQHRDEAHALFGYKFAQHASLSGILRFARRVHRHAWVEIVVEKEHLRVSSAGLGESSAMAELEVVSLCQYQTSWLNLYSAPEIFEARNNSLGELCRIALNKDFVQLESTHNF